MNVFLGALAALLVGIAGYQGIHLRHQHVVSQEHIGEIGSAVQLALVGERAGTSLGDIVRSHFRERFNRDVGSSVVLLRDDPDIAREWRAAARATFPPARTGHLPRRTARAGGQTWAGATAPDAAAPVHHQPPSATRRITVDLGIAWSTATGQPSREARP